MLDRRPVQMSLLFFLSVSQVCTAVVTGMAGCAGMILQQEPTPPKTAQNFLATLTPQVCSETLLICCYPLMMNSPLILCCTLFKYHFQGSTRLNFEHSSKHSPNHVVSESSLIKATEIRMTKTK